MLSSSTILIAEDNPDDVFLLKRAFSKLHWAHPLQVVHDGDEAVRYLAGEGRYLNREQYPLPFLFLLDLKMPKRDGFEVLTWLRVQPQLKFLPVLVLTSSDLGRDVIRAHELGATSYLVKPGGIDRMVETLDSVLRFWRMVRQPASGLKEDTTTILAAAPPRQAA